MKNMHTNFESAVENETTRADDRKVFLETKIPKYLVVLNAVLAVVYFFVIAFYFPHGNIILFGLLIVGEIFHVWQLLTYLYTVYDTEYMPSKDDNFLPPVDVFITVAGEPVEIVEETARAARDMDYPNFKVHLLNDGYVAKKENYRDIEILAVRLGINCITRKVPGGAKAGNINNALKQTSCPFFAVLDTDHVPHKDFLRKMVGYFADKKMAFVQAPQYYKNYRENMVTQGAWEQQALFFGPICKGKNRLNSVTMCGTNMVLRRSALAEVGNMCEESVAEDLLTGMLLHERGWKSCYVPEVLTEGLAPEDFLSYFKQQHRWARGIMDMIFRYNFIFRRGLSLQQKIQYLSSASYYFSGGVVVMNAILPLAFFYTGAVAIQTSTMLLATVFLPYILFTLYVLQRSSNYSYSFRSLVFSMAGFNIHLSAMWSAMTRKKIAFAVTSKTKVQGNFINLVVPQISYVVLALVGIGYAVLKNGIVASVVTNAAWAMLNIAIFGHFVTAALPQAAASREAQRLPSGIRAIPLRAEREKQRREEDLQPVLG